MACFARREGIGCPLWRWSPLVNSWVGSRPQPVVISRGRPVARTASKRASGGKTHGDKQDVAPEDRGKQIKQDEPIISLRGVTKRFGSHTVLEDISFDVPKGRITAILGPSGTGKSVLLKNII